MEPDRILAAISSLNEPWRSRFEEFIANVATGWTWNGKGRPTEDELRAWLQEDLDLRRLVALMVYVWRGSGRTRPGRAGGYG